MNKREANNKDIIGAFSQMFGPDLSLSTKEKQALQRIRKQEEQSKAKLRASYYSFVKSGAQTNRTEQKPTEQKQVKQKPTKINLFDDNMTPAEVNAIDKIKRDIGLKDNVNYWQVKKGRYWTFRYLTEDDYADEYITVYRRYDIETGQFTEKVFNFIYSDIWYDQVSEKFKIITKNSGLRSKIQKQILKFEQQHKYGVTDEETRRNLVEFYNGIQ